MQSLPRKQIVLLVIWTTCFAAKKRVVLRLITYAISPVQFHVCELCVAIVKKLNENYFNGV